MRNNVMIKYPTSGEVPKCCAITAVAGEGVEDAKVLGATESTSMDIQGCGRLTR